MDYLVGGVGAAGSGGRTCHIAGPRSAVTASPSIARDVGASGRAGFAVPDTQGQREILQQELDKARQGLVSFDASGTLAPEAGTREAQRARKVGDVQSLEAELARLPRLQR